MLYRQEGCKFRVHCKALIYLLQTKVSLRGAVIDVGNGSDIFLLHRQYCFLSSATHPKEGRLEFRLGTGEVETRAQWSQGTPVVAVHRKRAANTTVTTTITTAETNRPPQYARTASSSNQQANVDGWYTQWRIQKLSRPVTYTQDCFMAGRGVI